MLQHVVFYIIVAAPTYSAHITVEAACFQDSRPLERYIYYYYYTTIIIVIIIFYYYRFLHVGGGRAHGIKKCPEMGGRARVAEWS